MVRLGVRRKKRAKSSSSTAGSRQIMLQTEKCNYKYPLGAMNAKITHSKNHKCLFLETENCNLDEKSKKQTELNEKSICFYAHFYVLLLCFPNNNLGNSIFVSPNKREHHFLHLVHCSGSHLSSKRSNAVGKLIVIIQSKEELVGLGPRHKGKPRWRQVWRRRQLLSLSPLKFFSKLFSQHSYTGQGNFKNCK